MAINLYAGLQGHGKTYEVVSGVIVPAIMKGRRIVTNIDGLDAEAIKGFIHKQSAQVVEPVIVVVTSKDMQSDKFLPFEEDEITVETTVKGGDLVVVDEAWKVWGRGMRLQPNHMAFMRFHRHYSCAETGFTCDLVVMSQAVGDLHKDLRSVIERTFVMRKLKELGMDKGYTVHQYELDKVRKGNLINNWVKRYNADVFPLYKSYQRGGQAIEAHVDARQNIFADRRLWWKVALLVVVSVVSVWWLYGFFHQGFDAKGQKDAQTKDAPKKDGVDVAAAAARAVVAPKRKDNLSGEWQAVGYYARGPMTVLVLRSADGRYREVYDPNLQTRGFSFSAVVDGEGAAPWSGKSKSVMGGLVK